MERCEECGHEFVVTGRRQEKRIEAHKNITGKIACDPCIKRIKRKAMDEMIQEAVHKVMAKRMAPDPETLDEIIQEDPVIEMAAEEEWEDGIYR